MLSNFYFCYIEFQYPNKKAMILQDHREVETKSDNIGDEMQALEDVSNDNVEYLVNGESLVIRCTLNVEIKEDDLEK